MDPSKVAVALRLADEGLTLNQIADQVGVSIQTLGRAGIRTHGYSQGRRAHKKDRHLSKVIALHNEGAAVEEIAQQVQIHWQTAAEWLKSEGLQPRYAKQTTTTAIRPETKDHPQYAEVVRLHTAGSAEYAIATQLGLSRYQVREIITDAGIAGQGGRAAKRTTKAQRACNLYREGKPLDAIIKTVRVDYYSLRLALEEAGLLAYPDDEKPDNRCPCGKLTGSKNRLYCGPEHRLEYGEKRKADPDNYVTLTCVGCGIEFTRRKSYPGAHKYHSNECAAKHTKKKVHIVVEDAIVLDSGFEAFFWGLCSLWKIPCERADRGLAVRVGEGWYCPDFWLPSLDIYVEIKGPEDEDDRARYAAWRAEERQLAVLRREELHTLRTRANDHAVKQQLRIWSAD